MTKRLPVLLIVLLSVPAFAGESGYASGESCTVAANVVSCSSVVGRGSLVIESSEGAFVKLRNALTPNWDGIMTCSECNVAAGFPGCAADGDAVATTRNKAAIARLSCTLRSLVVQVDDAVAVDTARAGVDRNPDIGGGDPG